MTSAVGHEPGGRAMLASSAPSAYRRVAHSRGAWTLLAALAVALLAIGSVHGSASQAARVSHLDSVIKCPSCEDLSIAQSNAPLAVGLRAEVAAKVAAGESDATIEAEVVAAYGPSILLVPPSHGVDALVFVLPVAALAVALPVAGVVIWRRRQWSSQRGGSSESSDDAAGTSRDEALVDAALRVRRTEAG
ncbi:MAG TPA: cytochrome c-type biogenesis protein CcmH [Acidimicrobiales bacterium]|nr:cytochrome c-type biogenesis protein CcmH [Acidimicrobiales bacterium]